MSKRVRPWDKATRSQPSFNNKLPATAVSSSSNTSKATAVPFVEVDGHRYYSDRFYLNTSVLDDDVKEKQSVGSTAAAGVNCKCGARNPPPLLDRSRLVASLQLEGAILATYTLSPEAVLQQFPSLFGPDASVPTLVLHGQKGWAPYQTKNEKSAVNDNDSDSEDDERQEESPPQALFSDDGTVGTQEDATMRAADQFASPAGATKPSELFVGNDKAAAATPKGRATFDKDRSPLPGHVHWTEILPTWIPLRDRPATTSASITTEGTVSEHVASKRLWKRGVHHPKYMILLETSGSIVVVVTTVNLTQPVSTDASWVQRFPAAVLVQNKGAASSSSSSTATSTADNTADGSDFGAVLANMLQCQTWASQVDQLTPAGFVRRYFGWKGLRDLEKKFDYAKAQVHLVATVPGDHEGRLSQVLDKSRRFYYGRQRVAHVLSKLSRGSLAWLPPVILHEEDRLVMQPTSLGGEWSIRNMSDVVRSYLGLDDRKRPQQSRHTDRSVLERLDIVWPTMDFVRELKNWMQGRQSPDSTAVAAIEFGFSPQSDQDKGDFVEDSASLFLSSVTFNKIDMSVVSQMVMFEPSVPSQRPQTLVPHFKSIARLCEGSEYRLRKDFGFKKSEESFSWFLLTSACLSRGAQGDTTPNSPPGSDAVSYSNFELGVLFCSRLQGQAGTDRLYCWKPAHCTCARPTGGPSLIHLPVPYCFRPSRYQEDEDVAEFCETPYFHEIPPGTGTVGHMQLTPYGIALAEKCTELA